MLIEKRLKETLSRSFKKTNIYDRWLDRQSWGEIFRKSFDLKWAQQTLDPILGCLKMKKRSIKIHRLEKELVYLTALSIDRGEQLFISVPVSPISLGILVVAYSAQIANALSSKAFVLWIRPEDNGKIKSLRTAKAFNFIEPWQSRIDFQSKIATISTDKISEPLGGNKLKVVIVRSLGEGWKVLQKNYNCSLVVLDDGSGQTTPASSSYGEKALNLAKLCKRRGTRLVGIVPPWVMKDLEYNQVVDLADDYLLWPIDFFNLRSYSGDGNLFDRNRDKHHPIEESFLRLEKKRQCLHEAQVNIRTFSTEIKVGELFQSSSSLLLDLAKQPELRSVWEIGWEIWRTLAAPVLPFDLLWEQLVSRDLARLENAAQPFVQSPALHLHEMLKDLAQKLVTIKHNPFLEVIRSAEPETAIAIENAEQAHALEQYLMTIGSEADLPEILPISQVKDLGGDKLLVIGQPQGCHRDLLQRTFFLHVEVLMWSVLADSAENWWSNLEVNAREWHRKTWLALTGKDQIVRYGYSPQQTSVQLITPVKTKRYQSINMSALEEKFNGLTGRIIEASRTEFIAQSLESHYLVDLERGQKIRVAPDSEFLVLWRKQIRIVPVIDLKAGYKVVLFDGMNRDRLFAQMVGLLEDTKDNFLYRTQLESWRELVRQQVELFGLTNICLNLLRDTGVSVKEETVKYNWMQGHDLLGVPREKEHFFWFIPPLVHGEFEEFWEKADELRSKRGELGDIICSCASDGWQNRNPDKIIFQYQRVWITVGELRDWMQGLKVQGSPQLIKEKPAYPYNRLFNS